MAAEVPPGHHVQVGRGLSPLARRVGPASVVCDREARYDASRGGRAQLWVAHDVAGYDCAVHCPYLLLGFLGRAGSGRALVASAGLSAMAGEVRQPWGGCRRGAGARGVRAACDAAGASCAPGFFDVGEELVPRGHRLAEVPRRLPGALAFGRSRRSRRAPPSPVAPLASGAWRSCSAGERCPTWRLLSGGRRRRTASSSGPVSLAMPKRATSVASISSGVPRPRGALGHRAPEAEREKSRPGRSPASSQTA